MVIIEQTTTPHLGKEKPMRPLLAVDAGCVFMWFNSFSGDVWTADGWLITAAYSRDVWQVRKGNQTARVELAANEVLYSTTVPRSWDDMRTAYEAEVVA